jgi:hypothetical protein
MGIKRKLILNDRNPYIICSYNNKRR